MTRLLPLALALLACSAEAQFLPDGVQATPGGTKPALAFVPAAGAYPTPVGVKRGAALVFSRSSLAPYSPDGGAVASAADRVLRVESAGAEIEPKRLNIIPNSDQFTSRWSSTSSVGTVTAADSTATAPDGSLTASTISFPVSVSAAGNYELLRYNFTSTLPSTTYTASVYLMAGTTGAVWTRLSDGASVLSKALCTLSASTFTRCSNTITTSAGSSTLAFDIGADGNSAETISAGTVFAWRAGVEVNGAWMSSPIATSGLPTWRQPETLAAASVSVTDGNRLTGCVTVVPDWASAAPTADVPIWSMTSARLVFSVASRVFTFTAGGQTATSAAQSFPAKSSHAVCGAFQAGAPTCVTVDGTKTCSGGNASSFTPGATLYIGGDALGGFGGHLASATFTGPSGTSAGRSVTRAVGCIGDSITFGYSVKTAYPDTLNTSVGTYFRADNFGVSGQGTAPMVTQWTNDVKPGAYTAIVVLGGVNDLIGGRSAAWIFANLQSIYDDAIAAGVTVIPVTLTPYSGYASWTAAQQTQLLALNTSIRNYATAHSLSIIDAYARYGNNTGQPFATGTDATALGANCNSADGLHPGQPCQDDLAAQVKTALGY